MCSTTPAPLKTRPATSAYTNAVELAGLMTTVWFAPYRPMSTFASCARLLLSTAREPQSPK